MPIVTTTFPSFEEPTPTPPVKSGGGTEKLARIFLTFRMKDRDLRAYRVSWDRTKELLAEKNDQFLKVEKDKRNALVAAFKNESSDEQNKLVVGAKEKPRLIYEGDTFKVICYRVEIKGVYSTEDDVKRRMAPDAIKIETSIDYDPSMEDEKGIEREGLDFLENEYTPCENRPTVKVAIIDSGIDYSHEFLSDLDWQPHEDNKDIFGDVGAYKNKSGLDFANWNKENSNPADVIGHGTHIAGVIAGYAESVQEPGKKIPYPLKDIDLRLMNLKVGDEHFNFCRVVAAIYYAIENGADIINMSLGYYSKSARQNYKAVDAVYQAIKVAIENGILVVTSAGNGGVNIDNSECTHYPAAYVKDLNHDFLSVGSTKGRHNPNELAKHSNFGNKTVNMAAPGNHVLSTVPNGWEYLSGTSVAAAHVSRVASIILGGFRNNNYEPSLSELIDAIKQEGMFLETPDRYFIRHEKTLYA